MSGRASTSRNYHVPEERRRQLLAVERRRGRPSGKNRTPFSENERRLINAEKERMRRKKLKDRWAGLAASLGCDGQVPKIDVLAMAVRCLTRPRDQENIQDIKDINAKLKKQIRIVKRKLKEEPLESSQDFTDPSTPPPPPPPSQPPSPLQSIPFQNLEIPDNIDQLVEEMEWGEVLMPLRSILEDEEVEWPQ